MGSCSTKTTTAIVQPPSPQPLGETKLSSSPKMALIEEVDACESPDASPVRSCSPSLTAATASFLAEFCLSLRASPAVIFAENCQSLEEMPKPGSPEATYACAVRLKRLISLAEKDQLSKEDLVENLQYSVSVLEAIFDDETKRLSNEEEELPGVATATVPNEVRDWLTLTFTRRVSSASNAIGKPTFRTVANAIRAGIVVDRIIRRLSTPTMIDMSPGVQSIIKEQIDNWEFDVIDLNRLGDNHALKIVGFEILNRYDLIHKFKISAKVLENLLVVLEEGYSKHKNPYHNLVHAADVTQTCHCILNSTKLASVLSELEIFAIIFSALIHDYEHTGTTNNFHIKTSSELALIYNDKGVLENFHVSSIYHLMRDENLNILSHLSKEEYSEFRRMVIEMVLNTDMSLHFQQINSVRSLLTVPENVDKSQALSLILHCADISHPTKPWHLHEKWTDRLLQEFFRQGDMEQQRDLPYSPLCDRNNTLVAHSQIGFINFIVAPSFEVMTDLLTKIMGPLFGGKKQPLPEVAEEEETGEPEKVVENAKEEQTVQNNTRSKLSFPAPWLDFLKSNMVEWEKRKEIELKTKGKTST